MESIPNGTKRCNNAREYARRVLEGKPLNGLTPADCEPYVDVCHELERVAGDPEAVERVWEASVAAEPELAELLMDEEEPKGPPDEEEEEQGSAATRLVRLAEERCTFMRSDGGSYAKVRNNGEVLPLGSKTFEEYLSEQYLRMAGKVAPSGSLTDALTALRGIAAKTDEPVYVRTCGDAARVVFLDLGNGRVAHVTPSEIKIIPKADAPVNLWSPSAAKTLPDPDLTGTLDDIGAALALEGDALYVAAGWLLAALLPGGPYPVLAVYGPQGSGKSTRCRQLNRLLDPSGLLLRTQPKKTDDLIVAARAAHILSFDNVSKISDELSDGLCRVATGGGIAKRTLYTDADVTVVNVKRPVVINAIVDVVKRSDLADRLMLLELDRVAERRTERQVEERFRQHQAKALGALLKGVKAALCTWHSISLPDLPRMADACAWAEAGMRGIGAEPEGFFNAFTRAAQDASARIVEGDLVGSLVHTIATKGDGFLGTASTLLERMRSMASGQKRSLPTDATQLSIQLKRLAPALEAAHGYTIEYKRTRERRQWKIPSVSKNKVSDENASHASHTSQNDTAATHEAPKTVDSGECERLSEAPF